MTRRVVIGSRSSGSGLWVSKSGFDALTATGDNLLLSLDGGTEQIILMGVAFPLPQVVPLGLSQRPYVFLTSTGVVPVEFNVSQSTQAVAGLIRPYPFGDNPAQNCSAVVSASSLSLSGGSTSCHYIVVRRAAP